MTPLRTHLSRSHKRLGALLIVAVLAVPVVDAANRLRVHVDGDVVDVLSFGSTVGDLLDEQGVELAAGDTVLPHSSTPLDEVSTITVLRTIDVVLVVDDEATEVRGTWRTVEGLLEDVGVEVTAAQLLRPGPRTVLADGDRVTITSPSTITLQDAGETTTLSTHHETVGALLDSMGMELAEKQAVRPGLDEPLVDGTQVALEASRTVDVVADGTTRTVETYANKVGGLVDELGLVVGPDDLLTPARGANVPDGGEVVVQRVTFEEVVEEITVPFDEERRRTSSLYEGDSRVAVEGATGRRLDTYEVRLVDGERDGRELLGREVVTRPVTRVVEVGTKQRPAPPPPSNDSIWYRLAQCESGQRWDYNGSSGFDGGLQFHPSTWRNSKPGGYPDYAWQASPGQQIEVGKIVQRRQGWGAWPSCARKLGLL